MTGIFDIMGSEELYKLGILNPNGSKFFRLVAFLKGPLNMLSFYLRRDDPARS